MRRLFSAVKDFTGYCGLDSFQMMLSLLTLLAVGLIGTTAQFAPAGLRRVCYYTNWSQYRPNGGKFFPEDVDASLCTHLIYTFARLTGNQLQAFEWNDESTAWSTGMYERFQALKQQNPGAKTLLAVGGWNLGSGPFTQMVATPQSRAEFAQSAATFLRKWRFDGLDVDWEYPANRGSPAQDRDRFTDLIREVSAKFEQEAASTGHPRLLLTAAVGAGKEKIDTAYDIPHLNQYLDFISLMTYDLHGSWETHTGHHTALYPRANEQGDDRYLNLDFAAKYWVSLGASPSKLNIGLATYGRSFTLSSPSQNGLGDPTANPGAGAAGTYTQEPGFLAYYEICQMQQRGGLTHRDLEQHVPYLTEGSQWVGYEDASSLAQKVCYIKQNGYGGVMVWALDLDDFTGSMCGQGKYPLMHAINNEINNPTSANCPSAAGGPAVQTQAPGLGLAPTAYLFTLFPPPGQTVAPVNAFPAFPGVFSANPPNLIMQPAVNGGQQSTASSPLIPSNPLDFSCMNMPSDFYPNVHACDEYYICANQVSYRVKCAMGLYYNPLSKYCDWPANTHCVNLYTTQTQLTQPPPTQPPTQTYVPQQTAAPPGGGVNAFCASHADGAYAVPGDCSKYITCLSHVGAEGSCPSGLVFSKNLLLCQSSSFVQGCSQPIFG